MIPNGTDFRSLPERWLKRWLDRKFVVAYKLISYTNRAEIRMFIGMSNRPSFNAAWAASLRIYDPANPGATVARVIGGKVAENIAPTGRWTNTCAVRMSYILNQTGIFIPYKPGKTVSGNDKSWYFYYVRDVIAFLQQIWGNPDLVVKYPPANGGNLAGKKGVVLFEVSGWSDAAGHATLWDGTICYDHCYFNEPGVNYTTDQASFWELK
jgi:hypothetical protein